MTTAGLAAGCFCLLTHGSLWNSISSSYEAWTDGDKWCHAMTGEVVDQVIRELGNREYTRIVRQVDGASDSIKSCAYVQYMRASAQCQYDVPGGLRYIHDALKQYGNRDQYITAGLCGLAGYYGKFPRDGQIVYEICDEFAKVTKYPSQAVKFRAWIEDLRGNRDQALVLKRKAKQLWEKESHEDLRENPPMDLAGGVG